MRNLSAKHHLLLSYAISATIMCTLMCTASFHYSTFNSEPDLSIHSQFCWLISHHGLFEPATLLSSLLGFQASPLADHFSILLIPLAVVYRLIPSPLTLIFIQSLCAWLFIFGVILVIHRRLSNPTAKIITSAALSLYPPLHFQLVFDFHMDAFIALSIPWLWIGITEQRLWLFLSSLLVALLAKETGALFMLAFGIALSFTGQYRRLGIWVCAASIAWLLASQFLLQTLRGYRMHTAALTFYGYLGSSLEEIILNAILHPSKLLELLLSQDTVLAAIQMLLPLLFLPAVCPLFFIPSLAPFIQVFVSAHQPMRNFAYWGLIPCSAFLILGCVESISLITDNLVRKIRNGSERKALNLSQFAIALALLSSTILSWQIVFPYELYFGHGLKHLNAPRVQAIKEALKLIPNGAPVIASAHLLSHLSNRRLVWMFEWDNPLRDERTRLSQKWHGEMPSEDVYIAVELTPLCTRCTREKANILQQVKEMKRWRKIERLVENKHIVLLRYCPHDGHSE
ncbi:MAG: DUF2079 domain-containing protein [Armatimonadota bacterium]|nr:DUF2079 domain-containing protein [Armatimonadota bacterium]MCX7777722.1 DUF2079 domain-containing protein [Armatimonadota bacterium]MDW8025863.1 DUF2079 domain-containing protein [Armatimonadota bacterium]